MEECLSITEKLQETILNLRFKEVHDKLDGDHLILNKILKQTEETAKLVSSIEKRTFVLEETSRTCKIHEIAPAFEVYDKKTKIWIYITDHTGIALAGLIGIIFLVTALTPEIKTFLLNHLIDKLF